MKKTTIMIPTYNQAQYIEQSIDSALAQDYSNLEVIISDDSTNEETEKIVKEKYLSDPRIKYFHNTPALGRVGNYHKTLYEYATGDYALNLDGDDWLMDSNYLSKAVKILDSDEDVVCVIGNQITFNETLNKYIDRRLNKSLKKVNDGNEIFLNFPDKQISINHLSNVYRRSDAMAIEFYRKDTRSADRESILRLILGRKVGYIDGIAGAWRSHGQNFTTQSDVTEQYDDLQFVDSVYLFALEKKFFDDKILYEWYKKMKFMDLYGIFYDSVRHFNIKKFLKFHMLVLKHDKSLLLSLFPKLIKTIIFEHLINKTRKNK